MSRREMWADDMIEKVAALDARVEHLRGLLRTMEWGGDTGWCAACREHEPHHQPKCPVDAELRSTSAQPSPGRVRSPNARFMSPVAGCCGGTDKHADTCAEPSSYKPTEDP